MVAWRTCKSTVGHVEMYRRAIPHLVHDVICLLDMGNGRKSWALFCEHYVVSLSVCYPARYKAVNVVPVLILAMPHISSCDHFPQSIF